MKRIDNRMSRRDWMIKNKWYQLTPDELRAVVDSPKNSGIKDSIMTFELIKEYVADKFLEMSQVLTANNLNNMKIINQIDDLIA